MYLTWPFSPFVVIDFFPLPQLDTGIILLKFKPVDIIPRLREGFRKTERNVTE